MFQVRRKDDRPIEQSLFGLGLPYLVTMPVLVRIAFVPLESLKTGEEFIEETQV